jgi:GTP:adenosylcobinamide-phosphate guanylyltransferase
LEDVAAYEKDLNAALHSVELDATCMVITSDASIPRDSTFQAAITTLVYSGGDEVHRITSAAGKCTTPEAEQFSLQVELSAALHAGAN